MHSDEAGIPDVGEMRSYAADLWFEDVGALTDEMLLRRVLRSCAEEGGATVLGELFHVFENGAVTGILLLAQSHLSIHTWPELSLANVDLLGYGELAGDAMLDRLVSELGPKRTTRLCLTRGRY